MMSINSYLSVKVHACGGLKAAERAEDIRVLSEGVHVVVGTPGAVQALVDRSALRVDTLTLVVLDDADQFVSMKPLSEIFPKLPAGVQVCGANGRLVCEKRRAAAVFTAGFAQLV